MVARNLKVGTVIDKYFKQKGIVEKAIKELDKQKSKLLEIADTAHEAMKSQKLDTSGGKLGTAKIETVEHYNVKKWDKLYEYILEHNAFELLQKRLSKTAVVEHLEEIKRIPGVAKVKIREIKFSKLKKKSK